MGIMIVPGSEMPHQLLASVPDLHGASSSSAASVPPSAAAGAAGGSESSFQLLKADTKDPLVRQFVGGLVTGISPVPDYVSLSSREVQRGGSS